MKKQIQNSLSVIMITLLLSVFIDCSKKENSAPQGTGKLKLSVGISVTVSNVGSNLKSGMAIDDFRVQIFNSSNQVVRDFAHASEIPETLELPAGEYHAVASSDNNQPAAFENPYYQGNSGTFTITIGQTSTVNITCTLANIMVTVVYSSKVTSSFSDYSTKVSNATANLVFSKSETRAGYFDAGPLSIEANLVYSEGSESKTKTLTGNIASPQAGKHYEIHIDASLNNGNAAINITQDETVETEIINITEAGNEEPAGELIMGDLLITEIMYNPLFLSDNEGEWIEIYNNSSKTINLKNLVLRRIGNTTSSHLITSDVIMVPGSYKVLGRTATSTNNVAYVSGTSLTNTGDELIFQTYGTDGTNGTIICSVNFTDAGFQHNLDGKSLQLDPTIKDVNSAKLGSNWCAATQTYSTGDFGTPGLANSNCE